MAPPLYGLVHISSLLSLYNKAQSHASLCLSLSLSLSLSFSLKDKQRSKYGGILLAVVLASLLIHGSSVCVEGCRLSLVETQENWETLLQARYQRTPISVLHRQHKGDCGADLEDFISAHASLWSQHPPQSSFLLSSLEENLWYFLLPFYYIWLLGFQFLGHSATIPIMIFRICELPLTLCIWVVSDWN